MPTIVQKDAPILRERAEKVSSRDFSSPQLKKILRDMSTALENEADGVAIAAPQIGVPLRIFLVSHRAFEFTEEQVGPKNPTDVPKTLHADMVFVNPEIIKLSRRKKWIPEGCLSVRWLYGEVQRSQKATVRAYDADGKIFTYGGSGLLAQIFQHETDHLNGVLFIDTARHIEKITAEEQEVRRQDENNLNHR